MNRYTVVVTVEVEAENAGAAYAAIHRAIDVPLKDAAITFVDADWTDVERDDTPCEDCGLVSCGCA